MSSFDEIHETQADPDGLNRTLRESSGLGDSRTRAQEHRPVKRVGPYRFVRELARGGMGAVYEVIDERDGRHLALKTIRAELTDLESLDRFRREAELTAQLDHPNIARLHAAQLDADPCYLVQDLLTGGTLEQRLQAGPLPPPEARQIAIELGRGLAYAHQQGILHRDLSPRNVMFDAAGRPKLVDFGLARSLATWHRLTVTGQLLGTPAFMAPEQALDAKSADARSDVYGLGGLLYTMLTGAALIPPEAKTIPAAVEALQRWTPPAARALNPQVPVDLDAICARALAKDPLRRFSSINAMVAALEADGSEAAPPSKARLQGGLVGLIAGLAVALALALGFLLGRRDPPEPAPDPVTAATSPTQLPPPGPASAPTPSASPSVGAWTLAPKQTVAYHLTRWLETDGVRAALGVLLRLEVKTVSAARVELEATIVRLRYWVDGPYSLQFDSNRPRVAVDPTGEAQRALMAAVGKPIPARLDPRKPDSLRFLETAAVLQEPVTQLSPRSQAPHDRGWALSRLVETIGGPSLKRFFRGPKLRFRDGSPVANHREREGEIERLERVRLYTIAPGDNLTKICDALGVRMGGLSAHNRIEAPSKIRKGDVLELPPPTPVVTNPDVVALLQTRPARAPLVHARPWGVVLAAGKSGWAFAKLGEAKPWVRIQWGGGSAWVLARDTRPAPSAHAFEVVRAANLWVRSYAQQVTGNELGQVHQGQVYVSDPRRAENRIWYPIRFDDRKPPFVSKLFLRPLRR